MAYEAELSNVPDSIGLQNTLSNEFTNWREAEQARNLAKLMDSTANEPLLVWCGGRHHGKVEIDGWSPMGFQFVRQTGLNPFCIDQIVTITWSDSPPMLTAPVEFAPLFASRGGTLGVLSEEIPLLGMDHVDALLLSLDNRMG